jgi:hypothetical protein
MMSFFKVAAGLMIFFSLALLLTSCSEEETPASPRRAFLGITERDEFGDTLSVDTTDWVITGLTGSGSPATRLSMPLPRFRDGVRLTGGAAEDSSANQTYSIGAFPNPFIPSAGRLIIELILPQNLDVQLHLEDEENQINLTLVDQTLPAGIHQIVWNGEDAGGSPLPSKIYRIFFDSPLVTSFGDVEIIVSGISDPPGNAQYVLYAQQHFDPLEYLQWEFETAVDFGPDGQSGGNDGYPLPFSTWQLLDYGEKFIYLPIFMNYDLNSAGSYQYYYLLAYKHFQFGAGWPDDGDIGVPDPSLPQWQKENVYHNNFVDLFTGGP